jgi:hypothetical protein
MVNGEVGNGYKEVIILNFKINFDHRAEENQRNY